MKQLTTFFVPQPIVSVRRSTRFNVIRLGFIYAAIGKGKFSLIIRTGDTLDIRLFTNF